MNTPQELLGNIFSFLKFKEHLHASRVSKHWYASSKFEQLIPSYEIAWDKEVSFNVYESGCVINAHRNIHKISSLTNISINAFLCTDDILTNLSTLKFLKTLKVNFEGNFYIYGCRNVTSYFKSISNIKTLTSLSFVQVKECSLHDMWDENFHDLNELPLTYLDITGYTFLNMSDFNGISELRHLNTLILNTCSTSQPFSFESNIATMTNLTHLDFSSFHRLRCSDLASFKNLNLKSLNINDCYNIQADGLRHLTEISTLKSLKFRNLIPLSLQEQFIVDLINT